MRGREWTITMDQTALGRKMRLQGTRAGKGPSASRLRDLCQSGHVRRALGQSPALPSPTVHQQSHNPLDWPATAACSRICPFCVFNIRSSF